MAFQILAVQNSGPAANSRSRIVFHGEWIPEMGFISGALVQVLPLSGETVFNLCNGNVHYSSLFNATKEMGGTLVRVHDSNTHTCKGPVFVTTGKYIYKSGFEFGDELVDKCEYGRIRVRKVGEIMRLIHVGRSLEYHTGEPVPGGIIDRRLVYGYRL